MSSNKSLTVYNLSHWQSWESHMMIRMMHMEKEVPQTFSPQEWLATNFSLQNCLWIKHESYENRGDGHRLKQLLIVKQILLVSLFGNVWRTVWRICILILGSKGLRPNSIMVPDLAKFIAMVFARRRNHRKQNTTNSSQGKSYDSWFPFRRKGYHTVISLSKKKKDAIISHLLLSCPHS